MRQLFDKILELLWEFVFFLFSLSWLIIGGLCWALLKIFFRTSRANEIKRFFRPIIEIIDAFFRHFQREIRRKPSFRKIASVLFLILILLYYFPPISWGLWERYERGVASYYGWGFYCRAAASGEIYWPWKYAAAHKTLPLGTIVKVKNLDNGKTIYVRIFDRGPFVKGRIIDLTKRAGHDLGIVENGLADVEIYIK